MAKVIVSTERETISEYSSSEKYGDWSSDHTYRVTGVRLCSSIDDAWEETFELGDVKAGDEVHVLSIVYGTGDSFGKSSGNGEVVMVYKSRALAEQAYSMYDEKSGDYSIKLPFETPKGTEFRAISNPAAGYFECLESLDLETFIVGN